MEGFLAFLGMALLAIGCISVIFLIILLISLSLSKTPAEKANRVRLIKKTLLITTICFTIGTGSCALQFHFYPLHFN